MDRKIVWESKHYDYDILEGKLHQDEEEDSLPTLSSDDLQDELQNQVINQVSVTPFGLWKIDDTMHPMKQFKFWMGHTNFSIGRKARAVLKKVPGVEVLRIISRYRFIIAIGNLFTTSEVKLKIQEQLCGIHIKNIELSDGKRISDVLNDLKMNCKKWALYIFPNGKYDYVGTDLDNDILFNERKSTLAEAQTISSGVYLTSDTKCNLIEEK